MRTRVRKPGEAPVSASSSTLTEKPKRGRATIPDNFLLGSRNQWASLLEESWPEVAWPLLQIRKRPASTIDDLRRAFQPVREKRHNSGLAASFYRETVETATPAEVRKNRIRLGKLQRELLRIQTTLTETERSVSDIRFALTIAATEQVNGIEEEITKRQQAMVQLQSDFSRLTAEQKNLDQKCQDQAAYVYTSELLDFLHSPDRYAIRPLSVANALAGLPTMRWRQSHLRCSPLPHQEPRMHYRVLQVILKLWKQHPAGSKESLIEFFRAALPKVPKKIGYTRDFLLQNWRDLRLAIEECSSATYDAGEVPFAIASIFMRNTGTQKNPLDRVLIDQEKLS
jgi:hypothetical protein